MENKKTIHIIIISIISALILIYSCVFLPLEEFKFENTNEFGNGTTFFMVPTGTDLSSINNVFSISSGYWELDGQTGENNSGHGFKIFTEQEGLGYLLIIQDLSWSNTSFSYINIRHCEMEHTGSDNSSGAGKGYQVHSLAGINNSILQYSHIHDIPGMNIYLTRAESCIIEQNYCSRNRSDPVSHGEGIQSNENTKNIIVRYNTWEDIEGTAVIVATRDWQIYANTVFHTDGYPNPGQYGDGVSAFIYSGGLEIFPTTDNIIVNNTIYNLNTGANIKANGGIVFDSIYNPAGNKVYNNIWVKCAKIRFSGIKSLSHNYFYNNQNMTLNTGEYVQEGTESLFIDENNYNFNLNQQTEPALDLGYPFCYDGQGNLRGKDGIWSRGSYEY